MSRPSGQHQQETGGHIHNPVSFSLEANKAVVDNQTLGLMVRLFGEYESPAQPVLARAAAQMTEQTYEFLARAFPGMDADVALDEGMRLLCRSSHAHCLRVGDMASRFAMALGLGKATAYRLKRAAKYKEAGFLALTLASMDEHELDDLLEIIQAGGEYHDLGKLAIPDEILNKRGPLNDEEYRLVQLHPQVSEAMLIPLDAPEQLLAAVRGHHERWDGVGYPDGLAELDIPLEGRILGIVDSFDAMTESRPYRYQVSYEEAVEEIVREAGRQFDPELAEIFAELLLADED